MSSCTRARLSNTQMHTLLHNLSQERQHSKDSEQICYRCTSTATQNQAQSHYSTYTMSLFAFITNFNLQASGKFIFCNPWQDRYTKRRPGSHTYHDNKLTHLGTFQHPEHVMSSYLRQVINEPTIYEQLSLYNHASVKQQGHKHKFNTRRIIQTTGTYNTHRQTYLT